ncbi:MAG: glycosyltransferase, partial [Asticcacaulis sp.]|nr:glycosyltransferase [Asticcacaulis sp.]
MTLGFSLVGRMLTIHGLKNDPQTRLTLDGKPVDSADLAWKSGVATLRLPLFVFDARPHRLTVTPATGKPETFVHTSAYEAALTDSGDKIAGWVRDTTRPDHRIEIDIDLDGHTAATVTADQKATVGACGFAVKNPAKAGETRLLGIRVRGTDYYPVGKHLIRLSPLHAGQALDRHMPAGETRRALDAFNRQWLLTMARSGKPAAFPASWQASQPGHGETISHGVDVVVPVYRGKAETLACIDSILKARVETAYNLIVINDASPEPELVKALKAHALRHDYTLLDNAENLGFVATVNRGMSVSTDNDVVLVNSDTEVSDFWLDR